jgi:hypothetical protein
MAATPERCLKCNHWNFQKGKCDRIIKIKMLIAHGGGDLFVDTLPGVIPAHLEAELNEYLMYHLPNVIEAWPGWKEVLRLRDGKPCAAEQPSTAIKEFGKKLSLVKPLEAGEADPLQNKDHLGLFKSDISLW